MKEKIKYFIAKTLFGKPKIMSIYKDNNNNLYGSVIHDDDNKSYVHHVVNGNNQYVGELKIWI